MICFFLVLCWASNYNASKNDKVYCLILLNTVALNNSLHIFIVQHYLLCWIYFLVHSGYCHWNSWSSDRSNRNECVQSYGGIFCGKHTVLLEIYLLTLISYLIEFDHQLMVVFVKYLMFIVYLIVIISLKSIRIGLVFNFYNCYTCSLFFLTEEGKLFFIKEGNSFKFSCSLLAFCCTLSSKQ